MFQASNEKGSCATTQPTCTTVATMYATKSARRVFAVTVGAAISRVSPGSQDASLSDRTLRRFAMKKIALIASILFASTTAANAWPWQWRGDVTIHNDDEGRYRADE